MQALTEKLIALPFECALQTIQYVMTLGAAGFLAFIQANAVELAVMFFMRIAVQPVNFRLQRILKFRIAVQQAQRSGAPVPVMTPELEAIGMMSDMLRLMYRFSVDTLGSVVSPIAVIVIYLFRCVFCRGTNARVQLRAWSNRLVDPISSLIDACPLHNACLCL